MLSAPEISAIKTLMVHVTRPEEKDRSITKNLFLPSHKISGTPFILNAPAGTGLMRYCIDFIGILSNRFFSFHVEFNDPGDTGRIARTCSRAVIIQRLFNAYIQCFEIVCETLVLQKLHFGAGHFPLVSLIIEEAIEKYPYNFR